MSSALRVGCVLVAVILGACWGRGGDDEPPDAGIDAPGYSADFPVVVNRNLDVLFVVDNSGSMLAEQQQLVANFPVFINALEQAAGGLPDLHIGVLSSNVGASGQLSVPGCSGAGDDGNLLTGPPGNTCATQFGLQGTFISDIANPDGSRQRNYNQFQLPQLFTCMASLGTAGCGFEQHLESLFRSLQPGKNPGFLRPDAHLAVVFLADEDDCSTEMGTMFGDPNAGLTSQLGPRTSFRCHEFGVLCDNDPNPRAFGPRMGCRPHDSSQFMFEVSRYIDFMRGLKDGFDAKLIVAGIIGNFDAETGELTVGPDPNNPMFPQVQRSCFTRDPNDPDDGASPPVRMQAFVTAFEDHALQTICNENFSDAMLQIGEMVKDAMGNPCIDAELLDVDENTVGFQPGCTVKHVTVQLGGERSETEIPACAPAVQSGPTCNPGSAGQPCWCLIPDAQHCPSSVGNLSIGFAGVAPFGAIELFCRTPE